LLFLSAPDRSLSVAKILISHFSYLGKTNVFNYIFVYIIYESVQTRPA
jgi:hypothetical protein